MKKDLVVSEKLTLEEYQKKYNNPENKVAAKTFLFLLSALVGVVIGVCLVFLVLKLFEIHKVAGYCGIAASVLIFIFLYLVPLIKLNKMKPFVTNTNAFHARQAQRYNKALREEVADKMIEVNLKTEGVTWYNDEKVKQLIEARSKKDDKLLKSTLTSIYEVDVKDAASKLIKKSAVKVGITTAVSQSKELDTLFVVIYDLNLIKDIVFMYGYRPSDTKMALIYQTVVTNSLLAYGLSSATTGIGKTFGTSIVSAIDKASLSSNFFTSTIGSIAGGIAGTVLESSLQFGVNFTLTTIIGFQTQKYLQKEYHLQDMLDGIELPNTDEEEAAMLEAVKKEVKKEVGKKAKDIKPEPTKA